MSATTRGERARKDGRREAERYAGHLCGAAIDVPRYTSYAMGVPRKWETSPA
jgi:hypothetical protein